MRLHPVLRWLLWPASLLYGGYMRLRAWCYRRGILKQRRLKGAVISVGNLTVGGTGKTPLVMWIAQRLGDEGKRVGIVTRGYRASARTGILPSDSAHVASRVTPLKVFSDEVWLLSKRLGEGVRLGVGANRYAEGLELSRQGVEWFVLDDGFQHLRLARNVDVVLIDATDPFGGGHLLPAGRLREPKSSLARADVIVITRGERAPAIEAVVRRYTAAPVFYAVTELAGIFPLQQQANASQAADWRKQRFFAFCAIGNASAFFGDLERWGVQVAGEKAFRDHHRFRQADVEQIERGARAAGAEGLICTEKDVFNLRQVRFDSLPTYYCRVDLRLTESESFWQTIRSKGRGLHAEAAR